MGDLMRTVATVIIWISYVAVVGATLTSVTGPVADANGASLLGMMMVLGAGAAMMTYVVWHGGFTRGADRERDANYRRKKKRLQGNRIERLLQELDDEEVYALEALLLARDDETSAAHHHDESPPAP